MELPLIRHSVDGRVSPGQERALRRRDLDRREHLEHQRQLYVAAGHRHPAYQVTVWVRNASTTADVPEVGQTLAFPIQ